MKTYRHRDPDDLTPEQRERMCPSCHIRYRVAPKTAQDFYNAISLEPRVVRWLENAARVFDAESDELFKAEEFIAWLRPDLTGAAKVDNGNPRGGRPVEYDDAHHIADRVRQRALRARRRAA